MYEREALVVVLEVGCPAIFLTEFTRRVDHIVNPAGGVIVYMDDLQTCSLNILVPLGLLTVFEDEVFVAVTFIIYYVCLAALAGGLEVSDGHVLVFEHLVVYPSGNPFLIGSITGGAEAVVVVAGRVHEVKARHTEMSLIEDVIEVGIAQTVRELVADGTDTIDTRVAHLGRAGVRIDFDTIEGECYFGGSQFISVGPDSVIATTVGLALTGVDDIDLIHLAVTGPVVVREVYPTVSKLTGFLNHLLGMLVVAF